MKKPGPIDTRVMLIQQQLGNTEDFKVRRFQTLYGQKGALIYINNISDPKEINRLIFPRIYEEGKTQILQSRWIQETLPLREIEVTDDDAKIVENLLLGKVILMLEQDPDVCVFQAENFPFRQPEQPTVETTVKGTKEGFVESLSTNIALIRRYVPEKDLQVEHMEAGSLTKTKVALVYLNHVHLPEVLEEVKQRLKSIETDSILSSSEIKQWIEDNEWSIFPASRLTERPDSAAQSINDGKIAILTQNSPFAILVPFTFFETIQNMDDYYEKWYVSSMIRLVRLIAFFISIFLPGLYVALIHYNPGLIPSDLLVSIAQSRTQVPFPVIWELLIMEVTIEIFREAGIRLPKPLGQTVGIVGGIVIGESAVQANLVSPITLIVVAITTMASFSSPQYSMAYSFRLLRFLLIGAAGMMGLYGFILGSLVLTVHLASQKSFGIPYLSPFAPAQYRNWIDQFIILPLRWRNVKPSYLTKKKRKGDWKPLKRG
ncbi:MAG: spore germination protein [Bacillaceae bacterium]|nr:spore germination protein [Bacillaceae bacterium]